MVVPIMVARSPRAALPGGERSRSVHHRWEVCACWHRPGGAGAARPCAPGVADNARMPVPSASALRFLAIESSTDTLSIAVGSGLPGETMWTHTGPGSAQASITLLPQVRSLLGQAGWP